MVARIPSRGSDQFNLRFPDGMRERIRAAAEENGRSMNAEIIARLEASFEGGGQNEYVAQLEGLIVKFEEALARAKGSQG